MAPRCSFLLFALVFLLGSDIVYGGRPDTHSQLASPAVANYGEVFRFLEQEARREEGARNHILGTPTIPPARPFDADQDIVTIDAALTELEDDGMAKLIAIATERSFSQRAILFNLYFTNTGKVLTDVLGDILGRSSDIYRGFQALLEPAAWRDAGYLFESMNGAGTDDAELNEILVTRSYRQLEVISKVYKARFGTELKDDIAGDSWGVVETLLTAIVTAPRKIGLVTPDRVDQLATELYDAGAGKWGRDDAKFIEIFSSESYTTLRSVFHAYEAKYQSTVLEAVSSEFSRKARDLYMTMVKVILSTPQYFADLVSVDVEGAGTNEAGLARHILARADIDLVEIKQAYRSKYKETLTQAVEDDVSGDYLNLLLAAIKEEEPSKLNKANQSVQLA